MSAVEDTSEELLVARAQEGDADALLCLLDRYETLVPLRVEGNLPTALRRRVSAADVMQETRYYLWKATGKPEHLAEAKRLLDARVEPAPEEYRESMLKNVRLHREILEVWAAHGERSKAEDPP